MTVETTYTQARANLAKLCDRVANDRETVIIKRRKAPDVALIAADDLASLEETAYLFRSPANAKRLIAAIERAVKHPGPPTSVAELRREFGLAEEP